MIGQYGLNPDKLFKTESDNASNMKKAFQDSLWNVEDNIDSLKGDISLNEAKIAVDENEEFQDISVSFNKVFREQYRAPCNIHTLQLFTKDCIKAFPAKYHQVLQIAKVVC